MDYPEPLVIAPLRLPHKHTFILLHGRGSSGDKFGPALLETPIRQQDDDAQSSPKTLATCFPHARFVFPTAARRRATVYRRALTHQWFDNWKLDPPARDREELQIPGLHETTIYLHGILREEIARVPGGASSVVLGGLSQGCAASLTSLLLWDGARLAAWFGLCGWLPFASTLEELCYSIGLDEKREDDQEFDPFEREPEADDSEPTEKALNWLRDELEIPLFDSSRDTAHEKTPLFLGHGVEDEKVSIVLGRSAHRCVEKLRFDSCLREYELLGHWYSEDMLGDLVGFLRGKTGW